MKKVKTLVISLLIAFASSFMTACSCSTGSDAPVEQVLEQSIAIECTSSNVEVTKHEETGYLTIKCHKGSKFTIKYSLTPDNVTTTRVNWDYKGADDILSCDRNTYSQTSSEPVTFTARNVGNTVIEFVSDATKKTTQATVIVGDVPEALPTFVSVDTNNFSYDKNTAELSWPAVTNVIKNGEKLTCAQAGVSSPVGYEVRLLDLTNNTELDTVITAEPKITLPRGIEYSVQIIARGDIYTVKDSELSNAFKFCQLDSAKELKNSNGTISYIAPKFSRDNVVYCNEEDLEGKTRTLNCTNGPLKDEFPIDQLSKLEEYELSVVSYPFNYISNRGYSESASGIRYYPSVRSESIHVTRIANPTIDVENVGGSETIEDVVFSSSNSNSDPFIKTLIKWNSVVAGIDIKYGFALYKDGVKRYPTDANKEYEIFVPENGQGVGYFDTSTLWSMNLKGNYQFKVYAFGDENTTVQSEVCSKDIYFLSPLDSTTSITNSILKPSSAEGNLYGLQLFLVNTVDKTKSKGYFKTGENNGVYPNTKIREINLSQLGLKAGSYDIYARYVGIPTSAGYDKLSVTTPITKVNNDRLTVCDTPAGVYVSRDGELGIINVSGVEDYTVIVERTDTRNNQTESFEVGIVKGNSSSYTNPQYTQVTEK